MLVSHNNPIVFLVEFVEAVKQGWKIKDCVQGRPSHAFLHELQLFKGFSPEVEKLTSEFVTIEEYDSFEFLKKLQNAVLNDFQFNPKDVYWDTVGRKVCVLINPNYVEERQYSKKDLEEMEYEQLKKVGKQANAFHRSRDIMINRILEAQDKQQKES